MEKNGITQSKLAESLDTSQGFVSEVLSGSKRFSPEKCRKIIELSGGKVSWDDLYPPNHEQASNQ
jgi:DNA-binding transcriptional regulator YdaS (Cro superfamily)